MSESMRPDITPEIRAVAEDAFAENLPHADLTLDVEIGEGYCHCGENYPHPYDVSDSLIPHSAREVTSTFQVGAGQIAALITGIRDALDAHDNPRSHVGDVECVYCSPLRKALRTLEPKP